MIFRSIKLSVSIYFFNFIIYKKMKTITTFIFAMMFASQFCLADSFVQLDSLRHPNCQNSSGNAYFTMTFEPGTGGILVKFMLMPGSEYFNDFTVLASVSDVDYNGTEQYIYNSPAGNYKLYFVYTDMTEIDSIEFHFNDALINFIGSSGSPVSCNTDGSSSVSFSGGTPPYTLSISNNNWQTSTLIGTYPSSDPSQSIQVDNPLPIGQYQYKLHDTYCQKLFPDPLANFDVIGIGPFVPNSHISVCPEITGDTIILNGSWYSRDLTVISGAISTKWNDTLSVIVDFGDGSPLANFMLKVEDWEDGFTISHNYNNIGIYHVQYNIKNKRLGSDSWFNVNVSEYVDISNVSAPEFSISKNDVTLYPNPVENNLNLALFVPNECIITIQIFNITGQIIYENKRLLHEGQNTETFDVSHLSHGVYAIRFQTENKTHNLTFIK